jgi:hypothetical protein
MKNAIILFFSLVLISLSSLTAQTFVPMPLTGYNIDGVAENTTAIGNTGGAIDASDFVLYSQFYGTLYSGGTVGLPNNGLITSGSRTYQMGSYTASNVLHLTPNAVDTLVFTNPQAFPSISLLCFGTQGNATASVTVRFTDNSTQVFNPLTLTDWFSVTSPVYSGFDRVLRTSGAPALVGSAGNPRMMGLDLAILCANQGKTISKLIVRNTSSASRVCIMAVSGAVPSYSVNGNQNICSTAGTNLNASGFSTYTWTAAGNFSGSNSASVALSPTANTTYTLTGTDSFGCPGYTTVAVIVSTAVPNISFAGSTTSICLGAAATISASGALSYTLSSPAANGGSFVPTGTTVYTVQGSNGCGTSVATTTITVTPLTVSATANNTLVCSGSTTTLTASGASNYTWTPGLSTQTIFTAAPSVNTIYTLSGRTSSCNATTTIAIATNPLPVLNISPSSTSICNGDMVTLNVSGNALSYTWTPGNQTLTTISVTPSISILYGVSGTSSLNCLGNAQQVILVNATPSINVSATNYTVCAGNSTTITATGASNYTWSNAGTGSIIAVTPVGVQTFSVIGTETNNCSSTATIELMAYTPSITVSSNTSVCLGNSVIVSASGGSLYTWVNNNFGFATFAASPSITTIYTVNATVNYTPAGLLCTTSNTTQVSVLPNPIVNASASRTVMCKGEDNIISASGGNSYLWSTNANTASFVITPSLVTTNSYSVIVTGANGCQSNASISVRVNACTGIDEINSRKNIFNIFPNPNNGEFNVTADDKLQLIIVNQLGQIVKTLELNESNRFQTKISGLSSGLYFVNTANGQKNNAVKIIVNN